MAEAGWILTRLSGIPGSSHHGVWSRQAREVHVPMRGVTDRSVGTSNSLRVAGLQLECSCSCPAPTPQSLAPVAKQPSVACCWKHWSRMSRSTAPRTLWMWARRPVRQSCGAACKLRFAPLLLLHQAPSLGILLLFHLLEAQIRARQGSGYEKPGPRRSVVFGPSRLPGLVCSAKSAKSSRLPSRCPTQRRARSFSQSLAVAGGVQAGTNRKLRKT